MSNLTTKKRYRLSHVFVGAAAVNFCFAAFGGSTYDDALERSYFQGAVLVVLWVLDVLDRWAE